jgi:hypothetical protein
MINIGDRNSLEEPFAMVYAFPCNIKYFWFFWGKQRVKYAQNISSFLNPPHELPFPLSFLLFLVQAIQSLV